MKFDDTRPKETKVNPEHLFYAHSRWDIGELGNAAFPICDDPLKLLNQYLYLDDIIDMIKHDEKIKKKLDALRGRIVFMMRIVNKILNWEKRRKARTTNNSLSNSIISTSMT